MGRNGINIVAMAQGATETNVSIVVDRSLLRKSLNVIHDSFFLSEYQVLNLFVCGVGTVGAKLLEQISSQREKLMRERGLKLNIVGIASGHNAAFNRDGVDYVNYRETLKAGGPSSVKRLRDEVTGMNIFNSVFVDCTASKDVADLYQTFFEHNISVVAANKIAASSSYANYKRLKQTARAKGVKYLFETNVGAGLPIINTINNLTGSGDKILCIEAVLSGTLNYVFNVLSDKVTLSRAVQMARDAGAVEPDPRIDLCGKDVIRKLVILAREAGYEIETSDVEAVPFDTRRINEGNSRRFRCGSCRNSTPNLKNGAANSQLRANAGVMWPSSTTGTPRWDFRQSTHAIRSTTSKVRTTSYCLQRSATANIPCTSKDTGQAPTLQPQVCLPT